MKYEPTGTNLLDAVQAEAMVRYLVDGMMAPSTAAQGERDGMVLVPVEPTKEMIRVGADCITPAHTTSSREINAYRMSALGMYRAMIDAAIRTGEQTCCGNYRENGNCCGNYRERP